MKPKRFLKTEVEFSLIRRVLSTFRLKITTFQLGIIKGLLITKKRQQHDRKLPVEVGSSKSSQIL